MELVELELIFYGQFHGNFATYFSRSCCSIFSGRRAYWNQHQLRNPFGIKPGIDLNGDSKTHGWYYPHDLSQQYFAILS